MSADRKCSLFLAALLALPLAAGCIAQTGTGDENEGAQATDDISVVTTGNEVETVAVGATPTPGDPGDPNPSEPQPSPWRPNGPATNPSENPQTAQESVAPGSAPQPSPWQKGGPGSPNGPANGANAGPDQQLATGSNTTSSQQQQQQ